MSEFLDESEESKKRYLEYLQKDPVVFLREIQGIFVEEDPTTEAYCIYQYLVNKNFYSLFPQLPYSSLKPHMDKVECHKKYKSFVSIAISEIIKFPEGTEFNIPADQYRIAEINKIYRPGARDSIAKDSRYLKPVVNRVNDLLDIEKERDATEEALSVKWYSV